MFVREHWARLGVGYRELGGMAMMLRPEDFQWWERALVARQPMGAGPRRWKKGTLVT